MLEIKLLDDKVDYKELRPMEWDLVIDGKNYDIYHVEGYFHTLRYQKGSDAGLDYYCCPYGTPPGIDTLTPYDGPAGGVRWGIHVEESLRYRNKWGDQSWQESWICYILRNGEKFYEIWGREIDYCLAKARIDLIKLQEHPIPFHFRNWKKEVIGRTVFYRDEPAIITSYHEGSVIIEPDGINFFKKPAWSEREDFEWEAESTDGVRVDILDDSIFWHRETWGDKKNRQALREQHEVEEKAALMKKSEYLDVPGGGVYKNNPSIIHPEGVVDGDGGVKREPSIPMTVEDPKIAETTPVDEAIEALENDQVAEQAKKAKKVACKKNQQANRLGEKMKRYKSELENQFNKES